MDTNQSTRPKTTRRDSFVVRICQEEGGSGWIGWVQHVNTGESAPVWRLDDLLFFIECRIDESKAVIRKGLK